MKKGSRSEGYFTLKKVMIGYDWIKKHTIPAKRCNLVPGAGLEPA